MQTLEVFAEIGCPFAYVGLRRFASRRTEAGLHEPVLRVRAWPLELVNGEPLDAEFVAEEIEELRSQIASDLFRGFDVAAFPGTSLPAMALAAAANSKDPVVGEAVSFEIRDRLFEQGQDVTDPTVLAAIATEYGVEFDPTDTGGVVADYEEGVSRGVEGSPHYFTGGNSFFCPALVIERVDGKLAVRTDTAGFDMFIENCLHP